MVIDYDNIYDESIKELLVLLQEYIVSIDKEKYNALTDEYKEQYFLKNPHLGYYVRRYCFACDESYDISCKDCPLEIGVCKEEDSFYGDLLESVLNEDLVEVVNCCIKIRDAKVKKGVDFV